MPEAHICILDIYSILTHGKKDMSSLRAKYFDGRMKWNQYPKKLHLRGESLTSLKFTKPELPIHLKRYKKCKM